MGGVLILSAIGGAVWNFAKPRYYGLLITLNSGDKKLFTTTDSIGLRKAIGEIYELIETEEERTYQMSIYNSNVKGIFIQGDVGGNASFKSDQ